MGENLDSYEITPSDMGQDPENEPGVVEDAIASGGEPKPPISKCFTAIPFEARKHYRKLWESFEVKDMSFEDFAIEMHAMTNPVMIQRDLGRITQQKQMGNQTMAANLSKIKHGLN